jgi:hypothetical protein
VNPSSDPPDLSEKKKEPIRETPASLEFYVLRHSALSSADVDPRSLLPDVWIAAHPEQFRQYRREEAEAAARARKRRRENRRAKSKSGSPEVQGPEQPR